MFKCLLFYVFISYIAIHLFIINILSTIWMVYTTPPIACHHPPTLPKLRPLCPHIPETCPPVPVPVPQGSVAMLGRHVLCAVHTSSLLMDFPEPIPLECLQKG